MRELSFAFPVGRCKAHQILTQQRSNEVARDSLEAANVLLRCQPRAATRRGEMKLWGQVVYGGCVALRLGRSSNGRGLEASP